MIRVILLLWTILLLIYLNIKTADNIELVAKFEFENFDYLINSIKSDTTYRELKLHSLENETTKFTRQIREDTSYIREGIFYLIGALGLFLVSELSFFIHDKKKRQTTNSSL